MKETNSAVNANKRQPDMSPAIVRRRFGKAFPELTAWFAWLNGGYAAGAEWESLLVAHLGRIGRDRIERLRREVHDAQHIGLSDSRGLDVLVCDVLGLDQTILISEAMTAGSFLATFEFALGELVSQAR